MHTCEESRFLVVARTQLENLHNFYHRTHIVEESAYCFLDTRVTKAFSEWLVDVDLGVGLAKLVILPPRWLRSVYTSLPVD
jgi:hypothetical protein